MKGLSKIVLPFALGVFSLSNVFSQNVVDGCDYVRKLKVNRAGEKSVYEKNFNFKPRKVVFSEPLVGEAKNSLEGIIFNNYFQFNKSDLTEADKCDIGRYVSGVLNEYSIYEKITSFVVEGYADCSGNSEYNYNLSNRRSENVAKHLKSFFPHANIYVCAYGETQSKETSDSLEMQKDRVVRIIPNENPLKRALDVCPGNDYLLDQSGTMSEKINFYQGGRVSNYWKNLAEYRFPDSSNVYSFSQNVGVNYSRTYDINTEEAWGATAYYKSFDTLVHLIPEKSVITSVMNAEENVGGSAERILNKCRQKNLTLNSIGIDLDENWKRELIQIADGTNGKVYFIKKFN